MTELLRKSRKFGFWMALAFVLPIFVGGVNIVNAMNGEVKTEEVEEAHEISNDDLQKEYDEMELKLVEEENEKDLYEKKISEDFINYILVDEDGRVTFNNELMESENLSESNLKILRELKETIDKSNEMLEEGTIVLLDNQMVYKVDLDFQIQNNDFKFNFRYLKIPMIKIVNCGWFCFRTEWTSINIPNGFELISNSYIYSIIIAIIGMAADMLDYIISIITLDYEGIEKAALGYVKTLGEFTMRLFEGLSSFPLSINRNLVEILKMFLAGTGVIAIVKTVIKVISFATPSLEDGVNILNNAFKRKKGATLKYTVILYSGYELH